MIALALVLALQAQPAPAPAPPARVTISLDPARVQAGRDLVALILPPAQRDKIFEGVITSMMANMAAGMMRGNGLDEALAKSPSARQVFNDFMAEQRKLAIADIHDAMPGLLEAYAHAYARLFTIEEMVQIRAFLETPAGSRFATRSSAIIADPEVAGWQRDIAAKASARQQSQLRQFSEEMRAAFQKDEEHHVS